MAECLADLEVVERRVLVVEEQVVGAEVAGAAGGVSLVSCGIGGDDLVVGGRQVGAGDVVDLAGLVGGEVRSTGAAPISMTFWMNGLLVPLYFGLAS